MIRILHIVGKMDMAGLETLLMNFYRKIDRNEFQFDFVPLSGQKGFYDEEIFALGGNVIYPPHKYNWKTPRKFKKWFEKLIKDGRYNVLHSHNAGAAFILFPLAKKYNTKIVVHSHNAGKTKENPLVKILRRLASEASFKYVDIFLACSHEAGKYLFGKRNFVILNNAIDTRKFAYKQALREKVRTVLGLTNEFVIGTVGRLTYQKNPEAIIDIFSRIVKQYPNCKMIWIGEGELRHQIISAIHKKELVDKVIMLGSVSNVNEYLQAFDIFILPSRSEGLGIAAIEAQASGLPTLCSTNVPAIAAVTDLCEFIDDSNKDAWTASIIDKIKEPICRRDTSEEIKASGFDISCEVNKLTGIYTYICNKAGY